MLSVRHLPGTVKASVHEGDPGGSGAPGGDLIPIAVVDRVRGLVGEVVVSVHADDPARMRELAAVLVESSGAYREIPLQNCKILGQRAVLKLEGYDSPEAGRTLVGKTLFIPAGASTPAPEGRYYAYQLDGLAVHLRDGSRIGTVREVLKQGAQCLLVIDGRHGEFLVPLVKAICVEIDPDRGRITLDPPDGLIELNAGRREEI